MRCHLQRLDDRVVLSIRCPRLVQSKYCPWCDLPQILMRERHALEARSVAHPHLSYVSSDFGPSLCKRRAYLFTKFFRFRVAFLLKLQLWNARTRSITLPRILPAPAHPNITTNGALSLSFFTFSLRLVRTLRALTAPHSRMIKTFIFDWD